MAIGHGQRRVRQAGETHRPAGPPLHLQPGAARCGRTRPASRRVRSRDRGRPGAPRPRASAGTGSSSTVMARPDVSMLRPSQRVWPASAASRRAIDAVDVGDLLGRRASVAGLDVGVATVAAADVALDGLTALGRLERPRHAVGVAGQVGEHVADGPARQQARRRGVEPTPLEQVVEHGLEAPVGRRDPGDLSLPPSGVHGRTLRASLAGMQLGMIGLGRMGANMVRRLELAGHQCVGYDVDPEAVDSLAGETGMAGSTSLEEFVGQLDAPRHVWIMVPAAFVDATIAALGAAPRARRHHHRRRQLVVPRRHRPGRRRSTPTTASTTSTSARAAASTGSSAGTA